MGPAELRLGGTGGIWGRETQVLGEDSDKDKNALQEGGDGEVEVQSTGDDNRREVDAVMFQCGNRDCSDESVSMFPGACLSANEEEAGVVVTVTMAEGAPRPLGGGGDKLPPNLEQPWNPLTPTPRSRSCAPLGQLTQLADLIKCLAGTGAVL